MPAVKNTTPVSSKIALRTLFFICFVLSFLHIHRLLKKTVMAVEKGGQNGGRAAPWLAGSEQEWRAVKGAPFGAFIVTVPWPVGAPFSSLNDTHSEPRQNGSFLTAANTSTH